MSDTTFFCMTATPFKTDGDIDEDAFRQMLNRLIDARLGIYVGSGGSGEGHALSHAELKRLYEIAVDECRGKTPVHANPPEQHTARSTIAHAKLAVEAGIDVVHMYHLAGWHGMKPTDEEFYNYFDNVFKEIKHPIALAINPSMGYTPRAAMAIKLCQKYPQIVTVKLTNVPDTYHIEMREALGRDMSFHIILPASLAGLMLGADGIFGSESNIIPKTYRAYLDGWLAKDFVAMEEAYSQLRRCGQYLTRWGPSNPRWLKMGMRALKMTGHEGGVREPYAMPSDDEMQRFKEGLLALNIPEIQEQARSNGAI